MTADFKPLDSLEGRVAIVAGALGAVGKAACERLARRGARIVALHRRDAAEAAAFLRTLPGRDHFDVRADIVDSAALAQAAATVGGRCAGVAHVLVNTAGFTQPVAAADLDGLTDALIDDIFKANWRGVFATIRAFHPLLKASGAPDWKVTTQFTCQFETMRRAIGLDEVIQLRPGPNGMSYSP